MAEEGIKEGYGCLMKRIRVTIGNKNCAPEITERMKARKFWKLYECSDVPQ